MFLLTGDHFWLEFQLKMQLSTKRGKFQTDVAQLRAESEPMTQGDYETGCDRKSPLKWFARLKWSLIGRFVGRQGDHRISRIASIAGKPEQSQRFSTASNGVSVRQWLNCKRIIIVFGFARFRQNWSQSLSDIGKPIAFRSRLTLRRRLTGNRFNCFDSGSK